MCESAEVRRESAEPVSAESRESAAYPVGEADYSDSPPERTSTPTKTAAELKKEERMTISAIAIATTSQRAHYFVVDDNGDYEHKRYDVVGYAAMGGEVWPVRVVDRWGRGVLAGSDLDPDKEWFLGVLLAGEGLAEFGEAVDLEIREKLHAARAQ